MTSRKINWGVLGCAGIAEKHVIPALLLADNAVLYGVSSRSDSERLHQFAEKFRPLHTFTSYEALLADPQIDAVYIPLPNSLHAEWVKKAAAAKKHVLCEKAITMNSQELDEEVALAKEKNLILQRKKPGGTW